MDDSFDFENLIFLDVDGVLNCELFYQERFGNESFLSKKIVKPLYRLCKNFLKSKARKEEISWDEYYIGQLCSKRIAWLNELCKETKSAIVVSSTWRSGKSIDELQRLFNLVGATFKVIDKTGYCDCRIRGVEIYEWIKNNSEKYFKIPSYDFKNYVIIDDDSDMLLWQQEHFFQTDCYSGLTPNTCYRIKRFLTKRTFDF